MTSIAISQTQSFASPRRVFAVRVPIIAWNVLLLAVLAVLGGWYLVEVNGTMGRGYETSDAQRQIAALESRVRTNQVKLTQAETVGNLTAQATALGMVPVGNVEYVGIPTSGVALR
jgi:hypothetical protein